MHRWWRRCYSTVAVISSKFFFLLFTHFYIVSLLSVSRNRDCACFSKVIRSNSAENTASTDWYSDLPLLQRLQPIEVDWLTGTWDTPTRSDTLTDTNSTSQRTDLLLLAQRLYTWNHQRQRRAERENCGPLSFRNSGSRYIFCIFALSAFEIIPGVFCYFESDILATSSRE